MTPDQEQPAGECATCDGTGRVDDPAECLRCGHAGCGTIACPACGGTGLAASPAPTPADAAPPEPTSELRQHTYSPEDTIRALRSCLNVLADAFESVLDDYVPETRGRSHDDKDSYHGWRQQQYSSIANARSAIERSRDYES